ncbi:FmdB family zinc ribbon protein [Nakamurella sp. GG22]
MPTYQYACTECGHRFEAVQSFTDDSLTTCPVCSGQLRKVYGSVGVVFKGSGFYRTDSREGAKKGAAKVSGDKAAEKTGAKSDAAAAKSGSEKSSDSAGSSSSSSGGSSSGGSGSSSSGSSGSGSSSPTKAAAG